MADRRGVIGKLVILASASAGNICIDGNPDNIHRRFNRESRPVESHGLPKGW